LRNRPGRPEPQSAAIPEQKTENLGKITVPDHRAKACQRQCFRQGVFTRPRAAREGLTEDELAIFDLLTKPEPKLTKVQEVEVKKVARELLIKLQDHVNVFDWKARQQTRAVVQSTIRFTLNELPVEPYPESVWGTKVDAVWGYIFSRDRQTQASI
jgi:hypothetical protein